MKFCTKYDRPPKLYDPHSDEVLVETAGYIPAKNRIENLILAGMRLKASRAEQYDIQPGVDQDDCDIDPTRRADQFEVHAMRKALEGRFKSQLDAKKEVSTKSDDNKSVAPEVTE